MGFVLDCSVTMAWCFEDERTTATDALVTRVVDAGAIAPFLWPLEVTNVLLSAARQKRILPDSINHVAQQIAALPVVID